MLLSTAPFNRAARSAGLPSRLAAAGGLSKQWRLVFALSSFVVLYMAAIGFGLLSGGRQQGDLTTGNGDSIQQIIYIVLVGLVVVASLATDRVTKLLALPWPIVLVLAWCWLSVTWAIAPEISLRRIALTTIIAWTVFRSVDAIGYDQPLASARSVLVLTLVVNFFFVAFLPSGIHHGIDDTGSNLEGAWKGVTGHKNFAGAVCAFTILMFLYDTARINRWLRLAVLVGSAFFLYKTQSKTAAGILVPSLLIGLGFRFYNPAYRQLTLIAVGVVAAIVALLVRIYWNEIAHPFFMPSDFTNRGMIWNVLFGYTRQHWLLGSGYGSFWNIGASSPAYLYITRWQLWIAGIGNGHSGYFDLLATIGLPGLIMAVFATIIVPFYLLFRSYTVTPAQRALLGSMMAFCMGHNLTETSLLDRDSLVNVFVLLTVAMIYKTAGTRQFALTYMPRPAIADVPAAARPSLGRRATSPRREAGA